MKTKALISSILTIALCLSLIAGSTFALFTSESTVGIAVTAAKVEMTANIADLKLESVKADPNGTIVDERGGKYSYIECKDNFINGGTAIFDEDTNTLKLDRVTPGDKVSFNVIGTNTSDVTIQYRYIIEYTKGLDELAHGLIVSINGIEYNCLKSYTSAWMTLQPGQNITEIPVVIDLPVTAGDEFQGKSADIRVAVEAVQGNAATSEGSSLDLAVSSAEMLATALKSDVKNIAVTLTKDIEIPMSSLGSQTPGSGEYKLGGDQTETIDIDLNGHELNIATTYMSSIGAKNDDAVFTIKNGTLNSTGNKSTTWNIYDFTLSNCNYVIENVTFAKSVCLNNPGKTTTMKNVTINENNNLYGLWITAEGQNVVIDGLIVNSGRGIKIDEQYVAADEVAKVTLSVSNAKFDTSAKAAIMVKSAKGADIVLNNVDVANTPDPVHTVWVDEDSKDYIDLVTVTGGEKYYEGDVVSSATALSDAIANGDELIVVAPGNYTFPSGLKAGMTLVCGENTVFEGTSKLNINGATVIGATFSNPTGTAADQTINGTFENCTFTGKNGLRWAYAGETVVFKNCVFDGSTYGVHFDGGANTVVFEDCTISGFNAMGGAITNLIMKDCTFQATGRSGYNGINLWGSAELTGCTFVFDGTAHTEWVDIAGSNKTYIFTDCVVTDGVNEKDIKSVIGNYGTGNSITVDGEKVVIASNNTVLDDAIKNGETVIRLNDGEFVIPASAKGKTLTFIGNDNSSVAVTKVGNGGENCDYGLDGSTVVFENITITTNSSTYIGYARCNATYNNCTFEGTYTLYGKSEFNNCTFNISGDKYNIWTWGAPEATFNKCTFNSDGKALLLYGQANTKLTLNGCTFNDNGGLTDKKAAVEIGNDYNTSYELIVNNTVVNGYEINDKGINTGSTLWGNKNSMSQEKLNVVVDGVDVY